MLEQKNTVMQGNVGVGLAIAYFTMMGYSVSIPLNDTQPYDLVVDIDGKLNKVQVKTSTLIQNGKYKVELRSKYGSSKGKVSKFFTENDCDYLFIVTGDGTKYFIPRNEIKSKSNISLQEFHKKYIVQ